MTQIPQWMQNAGQQNYAFAQQVAEQPLQQYQGQMVADVAPQTQQAWNLAAQSANAGQDQYNASTAGYLNSLGQTPMSVTDPGNAQMIRAGQLSNTNLNPYMNPYTQSVINSTLPIMQQNLAQTQNQQANAANAANAFGGSRQGVQAGVTQSQGALGMAQMAQQLNQANFGQAQSAAQQDIANRLTASQANQAAQQANLNRNMQAQQLNQSAQQAKTNSDILAAQGLTNTGTAMNQANVANYGMLTSAGAGQSMQAQNQINAQMAKFNQAFNYPQTQLGTLLSALGITPHDTATSSTGQTTTTESPNWGSIITGALGDASDVFGMMKASDRNLKTDITQVDTHPTGVPIYTYRYKGDPKSYPKVMGPMAEDVAKIAPHAVMPMGTKGRLAVNMHTLNAFTPPPSPGVARGIQNMTGGGAPMTPPSSPGVAKGIASMSAFMPRGGATQGALANPRAGARAFGGLSNTKLNKPLPIRGALSSA
jgi:hypothetical protein